MRNWRGVMEVREKKRKASRRSCRVCGHSQHEFSGALDDDAFDDVGDVFALVDGGFDDLEDFFPLDDLHGILFFVEKFGDESAAEAVAARFVAGAVYARA